MSIIDAADEAAIAFLEARLAEDEKDFTLPRPHTFSSADAYHGAHRLDCAALLIGGIGTHDLDCDCGHPARILAEIAAKRALIQQCRDAVRYYGTGDMLGPIWVLAAIHKDHPDYQDGWAPA